MHMRFARRQCFPNSTALRKYLPRNNNIIKTENKRAKANGMVVAYTPLLYVRPQEPLIHVYAAAWWASLNCIWASGKCPFHLRVCWSNILSMSLVYLKKKFIKFLPFSVGFWCDRSLSLMWRTLTHTFVVFYVFLWCFTTSSAAPSNRDNPRTFIKYI